MNRRQFLGGALAGTALAAVGVPAVAAEMVMVPRRYGMTARWWRDSIPARLAAPGAGIYILSADAVRQIGGGDHAAGVAALDRMAASTRKSL